MYNYLYFSWTFNYVIMVRTNVNFCKKSSVETKVLVSSSINTHNNGCQSSLSGFPIKKNLYRTHNIKRLIRHHTSEYNRLEIRNGSERKQIIYILYIDLFIKLLAKSMKNKKKISNAFHTIIYFAAKNCCNVYKHFERPLRLTSVKLTLRVTLYGKH